MAGWTGLEPAAFCVTGRRSNQLSYHPEVGKEGERRMRPRQVKSGLDLGTTAFFNGCYSLMPRASASIPSPSSRRRITSGRQQISQS
jgi:hypothetical protein